MSDTQRTSGDGFGDELESNDPILVNPSADTSDRATPDVTQNGDESFVNNQDHNEEAVQTPASDNDPSGFSDVDRLEDDELVNEVQNDGGEPELDEQEEVAGPEYVDSPRTKPRKNFKLFCFECNRMEYHHPAAQHRWYYSYLVGLTYGLVLLFGPFQCQCCGHSRLMKRDKLNIRWWLHYHRDRKAADNG